MIFLAIGDGHGGRVTLTFAIMTWSDLSDLLHLQRRSIVPRPISDFARIGENQAATLKRLEKATRKSLDEAVRKFAKTKQWPALSEEQITMLYLRLSHAVDLTIALSKNADLFPALKDRDSEMIQWALIEAWDYPGQPHTLRIYSERRPNRSSQASHN